MTRKTTSYRQRIEKIHHELGIDPGYAEVRGLPLHEEAEFLIEVGVDVFGRPQRLTPEGKNGWEKLQSAAARDGVALALVSAFRDVSYQRSIIERKLASGLDLAAILRVNAAPGFSEHHTGRAIDITAPGSKPLEPSFESSPAFCWLREHAADHGFVLSYPRDNLHHIAYEPWHWCFKQV
jgi:D-alanyl-D-alanine carboxypeptidase